MRCACCEPIGLLAIAAAVFAWSAVAPADRMTWWMEVAPVLIVAPILVLSAQRFPLTPLLYRLILVHAVVLMVGGHYTYARVPVGFWFADWFELSRNHYDRLGHLLQGFVPAMAAREILIRRTPLGPGAWNAFLAGCVALSVSAVYELLEWWAALLFGGSAAQFLATQGDVWDTQWDMFMAVCGAIAALMLLSRIHNRQLYALETMEARRRV